MKFGESLEKVFLTLFKMGIFGAAHGEGEGKKFPPSLKSLTHIYNDETWQL